MKGIFLALLLITIITATYPNPPSCQMPRPQPRPHPQPQPQPYPLPYPHYPLPQPQPRPQPRPKPQPCQKPPRLTNKFELSYTSVCRKGTALLSCQGNIIWNNVIVASIAPSHRRPERKTITVVVKPGENRLQFEGAGISDSYGLIIDNVKLKRKGTK